MLFSRVIEEEEEDDELIIENQEIAHDLRESYVDSSKYEEVPKKKGFFEKIRGTPRSSQNISQKKFDFDVAYLDEALFTIAEEPPENSNNLSRRSSINLDSK